MKELLKLWIDYVINLFVGKKISVLTYNELYLDHIKPRNSFQLHLKKYQKINTTKTQNGMQASSIQCLQINRGVWITDKKEKQSQVVVASSWPVAHRYP